MPMSPKLLRPRASLGFDPRSISGLSLWLDGDTGVTLESGGVSRWADQSGNGRDFTQNSTTARPTYTATLNGRKVLTCAFSTLQRVARTGVTNADYATAAGASWWIVIRPSAFTNTFTVMNNGSDTDGIDNFQNSQSYPGQFRDQGWRNVFVAGNGGSIGLTTFGGTQLYGQVIDANANLHSYRLQGTQRRTSTSRHSAWRNLTNRNWDIGNIGGNANVDIAETLIYDRPLTESEIDRVEGWLAWRWGFQDQLPYTHPYATGFPGFGAQSVPTDPDAIDYLNRVAAADGLRVENLVAVAINDFVTGCKADGIWSAIKSSCLLMGARTLTGALTPLVGTSPTNNAFVSPDYNRKTGLGNAVGKSINSNRANNADPQNDCHAYVRMTQGPANGVTNVVFGTNWNPYNERVLTWFDQFQAANNYTENAGANKDPSLGFETSTSPKVIGGWGVSRSASDAWEWMNGNGPYARTSISAAPKSDNILIFGGLGMGANGRMAFYSLGTNLSLATLNARVSSLVDAIGAAIP